MITQVWATGKWKKQSQFTKWCPLSAMIDNIISMWLFKSVCTSFNWTYLKSAVISIRMVSIYLNTWSPGDITIWKGWGGLVLLEELSHEVDIRILKASGPHKRFSASYFLFQMWIVSCSCCLVCLCYHELLKPCKCKLN